MIGRDRADHGFEDSVADNNHKNEGFASSRLANNATTTKYFSSDVLKKQVDFPVSRSNKPLTTATPRDYQAC